MSSDMSDDESDVELYTDPPPDLQQSTNNNNVLLPAKSKQRYETMYQLFEKWQISKQTTLFSEDILLTFFHELSTTKSPSTLWSSFSMLKSMIKQQQSIDIGKYTNLLAFLKSRSKGYITVKAKVFTDDEIAKFINEAPDVIYLATKVVLIFGLMGACRTYELVNMSIDHIETHGRLFLVKIPKTEASNTARSFTISDHYFDIVKKYQELRPHYVQTNRFFLNYQKGKCTAQVIGKHKFAKMPRQIAEYLRLEDPNGYTGHSFRRTSTKLLSNISADFVLKRHRAWKSASKTESCVENNLHSKDKTDVFPNVYKPEPSTDDTQSSALKKIQDRDDSKMEMSSDYFFCDDQDISALNCVASEFQESHLVEMKIEASSVGSHESYLDEESEEFPLSNSFEQTGMTGRSSDLDNIMLARRNHADSIRDEFQIFGRSVAIELQKLPARDAILAKSEIQATLTRYRLKNTPPC